jgi:hypothetical protein
MWASWGVYDYFLHTEDERVLAVFRAGVDTLVRNLQDFDTGFWSLYEHSGTFLPMLASGFYHGLHIVQLRVMAKLTGESVFSDFADKWTAYTRSRWNTKRALAMKALFKLCYY